MTSAGAEALTSAIRRSIPLIVVLCVLGVAAMNVVKQTQGPRYSASARVLINPSPLSRILTDTQPGFTDPSRILDTAQSLATSRAVYADAARNRNLGSAGELRAATTVTADSSTDLLTFQAEAADAHRAQDIANAVAQSYERFRGRLSQAGINQAQQRLRGTLNTLPADSADRSALQQQLNRLEVLQSVNTSDAQVVDRAQSASQTSPNPVKDSLVGLSIGLVIALIAIAIREAIDTKVRSDNVIEEALAAPIIGSIASLPRGKRLVTYGRHKATFADSYDILAAQLALRDDDGQEVVAITSALPTEGKTSTASNLAVALARRGRDVILADFDFRTASLSEVFDVSTEAAGATSVIDGVARLDEVLVCASLNGPRPELSMNGSRPPQTEGGRLRILFSGGTVDWQQDPIPKTALADLIRQMRREADMVIIDTPPALLTAEIKDLSRYVDGVLVVVRQGRITQRSLQSLSRQTKTWETQLAGAVLTDISVEVRKPYPSGASKS